MENTGAITKLASSIAGLLLLVIVPTASAQLQVGDNLRMKAGGLLTAGYSGDYGDSAQIQSDHGIDFGFNGNVAGSYYNPNFISFTVTPYYNQSRADSDFQSITGASGVTATANLFTGSHFPGSITYRDDYNSTGTFGLVGQPDFTTHGRGNGFGIGWSALIPGLPTLSVGYSQGTGSGTVYGTDQESSSDTKLFNVRSTYSIEGFRLSGFFDHNTLDATYPEFLAGEQESVSNTSGHDYGFGVNRNLPINGSFFATYNRSQATTNFSGVNDNTSSYTTGTESSGATFHPTQKFSFFMNETYTDNLAGYLAQNLLNTGSVQTPINLGSGSNSLQYGGGGTYQFTNFLSTDAQATHYEQHYFGQSYAGTYLTGMVNYNRRILDMFTFSAGVVESSNAAGSNSLGFVGNANYFHRIKGWETSGTFSYAQNVQSVLITYTTSYYNYTARVRRRLPHGLSWLAAYNASRTGFTNYAGTGNHSASYSTSLSSRRFTLTGSYSKANGQSILTSAGLVSLPPTPGIPGSDLILFNGDSYGGGLSATPLRRLTISASFNRALSNTLSNTTNSRNNTELFNTQLQYRLRRIGLLAGYTRFSQGISASGLPPGTANSYFVGVSRWFDLF